MCRILPAQEGDFFRIKYGLSVSLGFISGHELCTSRTESRRAAQRRPCRGRMSRAPRTFRQSDLTRAIRALKAAGEQVAGVRFDSSGKPVIITGKGESGASSPNPWDEAVAKLAA